MSDGNMVPALFCGPVVRYVLVKHIVIVLVSPFIVLS